MDRFGRFGELPQRALAGGLDQHCRIIGELSDATMHDWHTRSPSTAFRRASWFRVGQFPALGSEEGHSLMRTCRPHPGLTARSHGTSLRVCKKGYLEASPLYPGTPKPMGYGGSLPDGLAAHCGLLSNRPTASLQPYCCNCGDPQRICFGREWKKHLAVHCSITPVTDPRGKMVTVSTNLSLELYLQLENLLAASREMDHSTAVLDEAYGARSDLHLDPAPFSNVSSLLQSERPCVS